MAEIDLTEFCESIVWLLKLLYSKRSEVAGVYKENELSEWIKLGEKVDLQFLKVISPKLCDGMLYLCSLMEISEESSPTIERYLHSKGGNRNSRTTFWLITQWLKKNNLEVDPLLSQEELIKDLQDGDQKIHYTFLECLMEKYYSQDDDTDLTTSLTESQQKVTDLVKNATQNAMETTFHSSKKETKPATPPKPQTSASSPSSSTKASDAKYPVVHPKVQISHDRLNDVTKDSIHITKGLVQDSVTESLSVSREEDHNLNTTDDKIGEGFINENLHTNRDSAEQDRGLNESLEQPEVTNPIVNENLDTTQETNNEDNSMNDSLYSFKGIKQHAAKGNLNTSSTTVGDVNESLDTTEETIVGNQCEDSLMNSTKSFQSSSMDKSNLSEKTLNETESSILTRDSIEKKSEPLNQADNDGLQKQRTDPANKATPSKAANSPLKDIVSPTSQNDTNVSISIHDVSGNEIVDSNGDKVNAITSSPEIQSPKDEKVQDPKECINESSNHTPIAKQNLEVRNKNPSVEIIADQDPRFINAKVETTPTLREYHQNQQLVSGNNSSEIAQESPQSKLIPVISQTPTIVSSQTPKAREANIDNQLKQPQLSLWSLDLNPDDYQSAQSIQIDVAYPAPGKKVDVSDYFDVSDSRDGLIMEDLETIQDYKSEVKRLRELLLKERRKARQEKQKLKKKLRALDLTYKKPEGVSTYADLFQNTSKSSTPRKMLPVQESGDISLKEQSTPSENQETKPSTPTSRNSEVKANNSTSKNQETKSYLEMFKEQQEREKQNESGDITPSPRKKNRKKIPKRKNKSTKRFSYDKFPEDELICSSGDEFDYSPEKEPMLLSSDDESSDPSVHDSSYFDTDKANFAEREKMKLNASNRSEFSNSISSVRSSTIRQDTWEPKMKKTPKRSPMRKKTPSKSPMRSPISKSTTPKNKTKTSAPSSEDESHENPIEDDIASNSPFNQLKSKKEATKAFEIPASDVSSSNQFEDKLERMRKYHTIRKQKLKTLVRRNSTRNFHRSNKSLLRNAIQHVCLRGPVNKVQLTEVLEVLNQSEEEQFILLIKDSKTPLFRALYTFNELKQVVKLYGKGPKILTTERVKDFLRYDTAGKRFNPIPQRDFGGTIDACCLIPQRSRKISYA